MEVTDYESSSHCRASKRRLSEVHTIDTCGSDTWYFLINTLKLCVVRVRIAKTQRKGIWKSVVVLLDSPWSWEEFNSLFQVNKHGFLSREQDCDIPAAYSV